MPTTQRDILRVTETAVRSTLDALLGDMQGRVGVRDGMAQEVLTSCVAHISQLYALARHRVYARFDETFAVSTSTGLPSSVEISKVYQDTVTPPAPASTLASEKASIVEHVLEKGQVPHAYVDKAVRTAYSIHAAKVDLTDRFWVAVPVSDTEHMYWCAWFHHTVDGKFAVYVMRFEMDWSVSDTATMLERLAHETRSGNMTSPGIFGARLDEALPELFPKEVHAWFIQSFAQGDTLSDTADYHWDDDEFMVSVLYEQARSSGEKTVSRGLFGSVMRQVWETGGDSESADRLVRRKKNIVVAPHTVLQRMSDKVASQSLLPITAVTNLERSSQ